MELVSVVMSIYNPNIEYLIKQIKSIDAQNYENIEILIWDDNPNTSVDEGIFNNIIKKYPYRYLKGEVNLGYAKAFEKLTTLAHGTYIAYCDQDDIWMENKISKMVDVAIKENAVLVTADRAIIDENDRILVPSCRKKTPQINNTWNTGDKIIPAAIFNTFAIGMNILMRTNVANDLLPFPDDTAHDKWLTAGAGVKGKVAFLDEVLVQYRRHGKNVSGIFQNILTKEDYYSKRVLYSYNLAMIFVERFPELTNEDKKSIIEFATARKEKRVLTIFKYRRLAPEIAKFEIIFRFIPNFIFKCMIRVIK